MKRKKRQKKQFPNPFNDKNFRERFAEVWHEVKALMDCSPEEMLLGPWPMMGRFEARIGWLSDMCLQIGRHRARLCMENRDISDWALAQTFEHICNQIGEADMETVSQETKEMTDED